MYSVLILSSLVQREAKLKETNSSFKNGGFCGWVGNPSNENKVFKNKDAKPWISANKMTKDLA